MKRRRLQWRVFNSTFAILMLCLAAAWIASLMFASAFFRESERARLEVAAGHAALRFSEPIARGDTQDVRELASQFAGVTGARYTVLTAQGRVITDSRAEREEMDFHGDRPEVVAALATGKPASHRRFSQTVQEELLYVADLVRDGGGNVIGVVRVGESTARMRQTLSTLRVRLHLLFALLAVASAGAALLHARHFARPIEELRAGAERFGRGDLKRRVPIYPAYELADLAEALNTMAAQLDKRIDEITRQRNEREAIFESMQEGVLAIDAGERILSINRAAANLLGVVAPAAAGKLVQEAVRHVDLQRFLSEALSGAAEGVHTATLSGAGEAILQVRSAPLRDAEGRRMGLLVILADVTRLHHLENLRRDFVANVSHELKTPITSIKGYAETLLEGAIEEPGHARRMVDVIRRQADRLREIIEDLLSLSRLDRQEPIEREECALRDIIAQAIEVTSHQAASRNVPVSVICPAEIRVFGNTTLLAQAIANLVENAVKYGNGGNEVSVCATERVSEIRIAVQDKGWGIAREHLPRLFERFYRVDKARSRDLGGTGLGLSIVKHVAQAHGGRVDVESEPGKGSTFSLYLPRP